MTGRQEPIHVLICGTGAVGGFYGSRLHLPESNPPVLVSTVCRSNYNAVSANGLHMDTHSYGKYHFKPHAVYRNTSEASERQWDYVVVTTKALPDVLDDSELIQDVVTPGKTSIVLIQNGVGVEEPHRQRFSKNPILSAVTVVSAAQVEPGHIVQNRWTRISIGPYLQSASLNADQTTDSHLGEMSTARTEEFVQLLKNGGVKDAEVYDEAGLQLVRWHKIAIKWVGSMNPSAVLSGGVGNAAMSLDEETRRHLRACMIEVLETAPKVLGRPFPAKLATADAILKSTERNTSGKPSMLLDWEAGRPMELEVILGYPVKIARAKGFEMPRLQSMYALLKLAQKQRDARAAKAKSKL
ncbi:2-dehydropantoate 2-reductase [Cystobasidium minutum MCA 4210]|uniref:2-dehydropantoate 2-reductase n=1 Tax=Cystobasidium minutum MCA 4210 TaxID=1397322 RepID=UPI0034D015F6|eukprot:jgi/Rhomi1/192455/gm1.669_g